MSATHEVTNQVPPLVGHDPIAGDAALAEACLRHADAATLASLAELGRLAGSEQAQEWGRLANENPPKLRTHDRYGHRVDEVEFHPAWHELMRTRRRARPGRRARGPRSGRRRARARPPGGRLRRLDAGRGGPRLPGDHDLRRRPGAAPRPRTWPRATSPGLTSRELPVRADRARPASAGLIAGMGMTEKQGGSDVRANTTRAVPQADGTYALTGHKWFTSAPMSDLFLVLAQLARGRLLLPRPPGAARRHAQRVPAAAAQGQAGRPVQRLQRGRVRRDDRLAGRRARPRRAGDHRDGQHDPAGLRAGLGGHGPGGAHPGDPPRPATAARSARCWSTSR